MQKKFLTFNELVARWSCSKNDIHYLISENSLTPSIVWNDILIVSEWQANSEENDKSLTLISVQDKKKINDFDSELTEKLSRWIYLRNVQVKGAYQYIFITASLEPYQQYKTSEAGWYRLACFDDCIQYSSVDHDYVERYAVFFTELITDIEVMFPQILAFIGANQEEGFKKDGAEKNKIAEYSSLDKNNSNYAIELDAALRAWQAVSIDEGKGKPKAKIMEWLDLHPTFKNLSKEAKKRIATVANWDKLGGATRTD